jgi:hypothetical protein
MKIVLFFSFLIKCFLNLLFKLVKLIGNIKFFEGENYISVNNKIIRKPFVEKPLKAEVFFFGFFTFDVFMIL